MSCKFASTFKKKVFAPLLHIIYIGNQKHLQDGLSGGEAGGVALEDGGGLSGDVDEGVGGEGDELSAETGSCGDGSNMDTSEIGVEWQVGWFVVFPLPATCLLYTSPSPRDA